MVYLFVDVDIEVVVLNDDGCSRRGPPGDVEGVVNATVVEAIIICAVIIAVTTLIFLELKKNIVSVFLCELDLFFRLLSS